MQKSLVILFVVCLLGLSSVEGVKAESVSPDLANFVTASILDITPGANVYSVFGHTAIRMQCPSKKLDYCFSFETEAGLFGYLSFFSGQSKAGFVPVPTREFLEQYRKEGRGVTEYAVNLTPREKQELWRQLDNDMLEGAHRKFNLLQNNCTSMAVLKIESILQGEYLDFGELPEPLYYKNGKGLMWYTRRSPWAQFIFMSFLGSEADTDWEQEKKFGPELLIPALENTKIRRSLSGGNAVGELPADQADSASSRPALTGKKIQLLPMRNTDAPSAITPDIVFGILLVLVAVFGGMQQLHLRKKGHSVRYSHRLWKVFSIAYFLASLFLLYVTVVAGLFGVHWNWLLIPFNLVPYLVWFFLRRSAIYNKVYLVYAGVLLLFVVFVPWITTQLLTAHYLIVDSFCLICVIHYLRLAAEKKRRQRHSA